MGAEVESLDALLAWGRGGMPELIEVHERRWEELKEVLKAVDAYWTETAPCSEGFALSDFLLGCCRAS
jgi:hypothetical protein